MSKACLFHQIPFPYCLLEGLENRVDSTEFWYCSHEPDFSLLKSVGHEVQSWPSSKSTSTCLTISDYRKSASINMKHLGLLYGFYCRLWLKNNVQFIDMFYSCSKTKVEAWHDIQMSTQSYNKWASTFCFYIRISNFAWLSKLTIHVGMWYANELQYINNL